MIFRAVTKCLGFLFGKLGLWGAAVFAVIYGACCIWAGATFRAVWFWVGALVGWVLGLTVNMLFYRLTHKNEIEKKPRSLSAVSAREAEVTLKTEPKENDFTTTLSDAEREAFDRKYAATGEKSAPTSEPEKAFEDEQARLRKRDEEEKPLVFATRKDPTLFIYEYPDRLQFYRKTGDRMIHLSTEYKTDAHVGRE